MPRAWRFPSESADAEFHAANAHDRIFYWIARDGGNDDPYPRRVVLAG